VAIPTATVGAVAEAQDIPPRDALEREIADALFASGALREGLDQLPSSRAALRGTLARARLEDLKKETARTDPTDAELAEATAANFVEFDRPEACRVIQALVQVPEDADVARKARARSLAERIAERVAQATDESEFRAAAESVEREGFDVVVQTLPPVAADGRVVDVDHPGVQPFVLSFARAASRLAHPGQKSGVVATEFGFHTMMLLERTPAFQVPLEERRRRLRDVILRERAIELKKELLSRLKATLATNVERSADSLLTTIAVGEHEGP
jgi:hypothetical protein